MKHHLIILSLNASLDSSSNSANYFIQCYVEAGRVSDLLSICPVAVAYEKKKKSMTITIAMFGVLKADVITNFKSPYNHNLLSYHLPGLLGPVKRASKIMGSVFKVI